MAEGSAFAGAPEPVTQAPRASPRAEATGLEVDAAMAEEDLQELNGSILAMVIKTLLSQGFALRELQSAVLTVHLGPLTNGLFTSMKATGLWYSKQVSGKKGQHNLGPPLPHILVTMMRWVVQVGGETKQLPYLKELLDNWLKADQKDQLKLAEVREEMFEKVPVLRLSKAFTPKGEGQIMKLYIRVTDARLRDALMSAFQRSGLERKLGMAPRGALERLLQYKLDNLKKKG